MVKCKLPLFLHDPDVTFSSWSCQQTWRVNWFEPTPTLMTHFGLTKSHLRVALARNHLGVQVYWKRLFLPSYTKLPAKWRQPMNFWKMKGRQIHFYDYLEKMRLGLKWWRRIFYKVPLWQLNLYACSDWLIKYCQKLFTGWR